MGRRLGRKYEKMEKQEIKTATNIGLAIWRLKCFYETFVQSSTAVNLLNFCAKNPPHRQAEKRYWSLMKISKRDEDFEI